MKSIGNSGVEDWSFGLVASGIYFISVEYFFFMANLCTIVDCFFVHDYVESSNFMHEPEIKSMIGALKYFLYFPNTNLNLVH